jgi:hypothetical protein
MRRETMRRCLWHDSLIGEVHYLLTTQSLPLTLQLTGGIPSTSSPTTHPDYVDLSVTPWREYEIHKTNKAWEHRRLMSRLRILGLVAQPSPLLFPLLMNRVEQITFSSKTPPAPTRTNYGGTLSEHGVFLFPLSRPFADIWT